MAGFAHFSTSSSFLAALLVLGVASSRSFSALDLISALDIAFLSASVPPVIIAIPVVEFSIKGYRLQNQKGF